MPPAKSTLVVMATLMVMAVPVTMMSMAVTMVAVPMAVMTVPVAMTIVAMTVSTTMMMMLDLLNRQGSRARQFNRLEWRRIGGRCQDQG